MPGGLRGGREQAVDTGFHPWAGIERMLQNERRLWSKCPVPDCVPELAPPHQLEGPGSELRLAGERERGQGMKGGDALCFIPCARDPL